MDHKTVSSKELPPETEKSVRTRANPPKLNADAEVPAAGNSEPLIAWRPVRITLELIDASHAGATAIAHSARDEQDSARIIRVGLCATHLLVNRSLHRADTFAIRFLIGLSLVEYSLFWWHVSDGRGVTDALRQAAGYRSDERSWGSGFASRLAISELLRSVDTLPIFGASPKAGPHRIGEFKAVTRHPSDIPRWRSSSAPEGEQIPKKPKLSRGSRVVAPEPLTTPAAPSPVSSFPETFLVCARETLDVATITALTELTKERLHD
jgi:hypothetical protein